MARHELLSALVLVACSAPPEAIVAREEPLVQAARPTPSEARPPAPQAPTRASIPHATGLEPAPAPTAGVSTLGQRPTYLTWSDDAQGSPWTHWVTAATGGFAELEARRGRWLSVAGAHWEVAVIAETVDLPSCEHLLEGTGPATGGTGRIETLVARTAGRERRLYEAPRDAHAVVATVDRVSVVGPYLFAETREWLDACGAFPEERRTLTTWDLRSWRRVDLGHAHRAARRALVEEAKLAIATTCDAPLHLGIGMFRPSFDGPQLLGEYVVTITPGCDELEEWTASSAALTLRSPDLPAPLAPLSALPAPVVDYFAAVPAHTPRGYTSPLGS